MEKFEERFHVRSYNVTDHGVLSPLAMMNYLQESAYQHARRLNLSFHDLREKGMLWVLSSIHLALGTLPSWDEVITVRTWPSGMKRLFALRDFEISDGSGDVFGRAVSAWLAIDGETRRPMRMDRTLGHNFADIPKVLDTTLDKLPEVEDTDGERLFAVRYRDIDVNGHVNNVSLVEWVIEALPPETLESATLAELEVNFLAEAGRRDAVISRWRSIDVNDGQSYIHSVIRSNDNVELVRARTIWRKRD